MKKLLLSRLYILLPPVILTAAFFLLQRNRAFMDATAPVTRAARRGIGAVTSLLPFSLYEAGATLFAVGALVLIVRTVVRLCRKKTRGRRTVVALRCAALIVTVAGYVLSAFLWLWCTLYYTTPFYDGVLANAGVTNAELLAVTEFFLEGANEYAEKVPRDADGRCAETAQDLIRRAADVLPFDILRGDFPSLTPPSALRVKPLFYSELTSVMGFTGVYFAPTAESNINVNAPVVTIPQTIAHELAHSLGVAPEDQTEFLGIMLCLYSDDPAFVYAGYLSGLIKLSNALSRGSWYSDRLHAAELSLMERYSETVRRDLGDIREYWSQYSSPSRPAEIESLGDALDLLYAAAVQTIGDAAETAFDGYLKSQGQSLGIRSYGACVDLVVEYVLIKGLTAV